MKRLPLRWPQALRLILRRLGNHIAAASAASTRELMARMGHSSMRAALIYQHATAERDQRIATAPNDMLRDQGVS